MEREKIIQELQKHDSTILNFPDRGPWGSSSYRGNCSGWIHAFLVWKYQVTKMAELFAGSGTGYDVAKDMGIAYSGADLNPIPVRPGILQNDATRDMVPESFLDADFLFMHPPYGLEIKIPYAGSMYADPTGELSRTDLGQMPWKQFMRTLNEIVMKYYAAMMNGGKLGILMGDVRRNGLHSMFTDIVKPGQLEQVLIKVQNNYTSKNRTYHSRNFVPLEHEYLLILKKVMPYLLTFQYPQEHQLDIRNSKTATWRDVVKAVMEHLGDKASLPEIYQEISGYEKAKQNPHWKEKVRQTLQITPCFSSSERGIWKLRAVA